MGAYHENYVCFGVVSIKYFCFPIERQIEARAERGCGRNLTPLANLPLQHTQSAKKCLVCFGKKTIIVRRMIKNHLCLVFEAGFLVSRTPMHSFSTSSYRRFLNYTVASKQIPCLYIYAYMTYTFNNNMIVLSYRYVYFN